MIRNGKSQVTSELAFLAQKPQNKLFIWKDKERLREETKYRMGKKKMKGLEREKVSVWNHQKGNKMEGTEKC